MRVAPRFVPTLTEVVQAPWVVARDRDRMPDADDDTLPAPAPASVAMPAPSVGPAASASAWQAVAPAVGSQSPSGGGAMAGPPVDALQGTASGAGTDPLALAAWIEAEVGDTLRRSLHDLIAQALVEQVDLVAERLRGDIGPLVRQAVLDAVAQETASRRPD